MRTAVGVQVTQQLPAEAHTFPADYASGAAGLASPSLSQGLQHYKPSPKEDTVGQPQVHLAAQQQVRALTSSMYAWGGVVCPVLGAGEVLNFLTPRLTAPICMSCAWAG